MVDPETDDTDREGSVILQGELTDTAPECPHCGLALQRETADGAWLECPSGDYVFDAEIGEAYAREHDRRSVDTGRDR